MSAQYVLHEERAGRTAVAVDGVVGRHDGLDLCVLDQHLECRKICLIEILERRFDIGSVSCGLRARMHGEVLGAGCGLEIVRVVALKPLDECRSQHARQIGVLAVGLHAAAPARITEDVDVGRPEGKSGVAAVVAYALCHLILGACLVRDGVAYAVEQFDVECGAKAYRLREYRSAAAAAHTVQTLVPPVIGLDAETLDARRRVHHLADLLVDVHRVEQLIDLLFHRLLRLLRASIAAALRMSICRFMPLWYLMFESVCRWQGSAAEPATSCGIAAMYPKVLACCRRYCCLWGRSSQWLLRLYKYNHCRRKNLVPERHSRRKIASFRRIGTLSILNADSVYAVGCAVKSV